jgi:hypothetical protein
MDTSYFENSRENTEKVIEVRKKLLAKTVTSNDIAILLAVADTGDCPLAEFSLWSVPLFWRRRFSRYAQGICLFR